MTTTDSTGCRATRHRPQLDLWPLLTFLPFWKVAGQLPSPSTCCKRTGYRFHRIGDFQTVLPTPSKVVKSHMFPPFQNGYDKVPRYFHSALQMDSIIKEVTCPMCIHGLSLRQFHDVTVSPRGFHLVLFSNNKMKKGEMLAKIVSQICLPNSWS